MMGKEWLYWVVGKRRSSAQREEMNNETGSGCMCGFFPIFIQFPSTHRNTLPSLQEEASTLSGVEAPRNSLELDEAALMPLLMKQQHDLNLNFPMGMKIKTSHDRISSYKSKSRLDDIWSECNTPGDHAKTPSLIARLMGLDLLPPPESTSPTIPRSRKDTTLFLSDHFAAAWSLPETPRTSSSSRKSDVERHRLSLQINKENILRDEDFSLSHHKIACRRGRSVGIDITNRIKSSENSTKASQNILLPIKPNNKNQKVKLAATKVSKTSETSSSSYDTVNHQSRHEVSKVKKQQQKKNSNKLAPRAAVRSTRKDEGFVRNKIQSKSKTSTPLSSVKNGPSLPHTKLPHHQVLDASSSKIRTQLSSKTSQSYKNHQPQLNHDKVLTACSNHGGALPDHINYIQIILKHAGITNQVSPLAKWHTPSNPIDLGVFNHLELKATVDGCNTALSRRCERKLIFQLVDELLAEIMTQRFKLKRWNSPFCDDGGYRLVEEICNKIEKFPAAKCEVVEDIDSLIDKDLCKSQSSGFWVEEEEMVGEIEGHIVEGLLCEAVAVMGSDAAAELN